MFATRMRTRWRSFATARSIAKLKPPLCSAESKLPIGVKIPFSTKCGEWVIYAEPVTIFRSTCTSGAQPPVARARSPVCPSLATLLLVLQWYTQTNMVQHMAQDTSYYSQHAAYEL